MLWALVGILIILGFIALVVGAPLFKFKMYGELAAVGGITMLGLLLAVIQLFDMPVPNPTDILGIIFAPLVDIIHGFLQ